MKVRFARDLNTKMLHVHVHCSGFGIIRMDFIEGLLKVDGKERIHHDCS